VPEFTSHAPGTFCWTELATTDQDAAKTFYTGLFGWTFNDFPMGPDDAYTMLQSRGLDVAALYTMRPEQRSQGVPPHWMSYVAVASADDSALKVRDLGGDVLAEPFDVLDVGRMAVLRDPAGAVFCIWEPKRHIGARRLGEPGALCWTELLTIDPGKAAPFYRQLFGWDAAEAPMGETSYTIFKVGDQPVAGMMKMTRELAAVPPHWMPYFAVEDADRAAEQIRALGGSVFAEPTDIPYGRFAVARDPQGAFFSFIKLAQTT
jgi:predicted enzyme related to lactoylglutathione lyase